MRRLLFVVAMLLAVSFECAAPGTFALQRAADRTSTCCPASPAAPATHAPHGQQPHAHLRGTAEGATLAPQNWDRLAALHTLAECQLAPGRIRRADTVRLVALRHDPRYLRTFVLLI